jgi:hypothetical protein
MTSKGFESVLASYIHLHFQSNPGLAPESVRGIARHRSLAMGSEARR